MSSFKKPTQIKKKTTPEKPYSKLVAQFLTILSSRYPDEKSDFI